MTNDKHIAAEELSAYIDGDLEEPRSQEIQSHLERCQECGRTADELRMLRSELSGLADAEPRRDLWPAVLKARARPPAVSWWRRFWMVPAAAVIGAAAALLVVLVLGRPVEDAKKPAGPLTALETVARAEVEYKNAIEALQAAAKTSQPEWSPETKAAVEQGLAQMDAAIEKCRAALRQNQTDPEAQEALLTAYQYKVDFLTDLVADSM
jgi:tetratricopeptide (TPR) repeat protein